jgi:anti-sigma factor RsiW
MNEHQTVQKLLPLLAAGVLEGKERAQVEAHLAGCELCSRESAIWRSYALGLARMPQPQVPEDLLLRAQAKVLRVQAAKTQRQNTPWLVLGLSVFGWSVSLVLWALLHMATGGQVVVLQVNVMRFDVWAAVSTALVWTSGAVSAILLARSRTEWRDAYDSFAR